MVFKMKLPLLVLIFLVSSSVCLGSKKEYERCLRSCQTRRGSGEEQQLCKYRCEEEYKKGRESDERKRREGGGSGDNPEWRGREEEEEEGEEEHENNPYYYTRKHFTTKLRSSEGKVRVLQRFSEKSELLRGIDNYRVALFVANPNTFTVPNHQDADIVLFVTWGRGAISLVRQDGRETHNIEKGDVMRIPAGTVVYLINKDSKEKLYIAKLLQPVSTPSHVEAFFGPGGENPESFYRSFSNDVLEAAFNTPYEKLERLIGQQRKGAIIRASQEQIRALTPHGQGPWPVVGKESNAPYNVLHHRPTQSNKYGQLYQVNPDDYKQLENMDVAVSFANITRGGMIGPYYNSRATKIAMVIQGSGYFEMACPHLSSSSSSSRGRRHEGGGGILQHHEQMGQYQKVRARLSVGDVFVAPAGHPIATVSTGDENLEIMCFEVNARGNERNPLVGRNSMLNQIQDEAKELAFNIPAREVNEILNNQRESFFFPGPNQHQEGRAYA